MGDITDDCCTYGGDNLTYSLSFDLKNYDYRGYLAARKAYDVSEHYILSDTAKKLFHNFIKPSLQKWEFAFEIPKEPWRSHHLDGKTLVYLGGKPTTVDGRSEEKTDASYCPEILFRTTPRTIKVKTHLERYGDETTLNVLEDLFLETYWSVPNLKRPSEILISNKGIEIAHPGAIPKILGALERLYQNERLENLIEIKKAIESDDVQGCAATILEDEYGKGLRKAVPKRFSF